MAALVAQIFRTVFLILGIEIVWGVVLPEPTKGAMNDHKCRFCVGEFLRGEDQCSQCGAELVSPVADSSRSRARSASEIFTPQNERLDIDRSQDGERDERDLESLLFDWKNPIVLNLVGSLVCAMLLIATLLELL